MLETKHAMRRIMALTDPPQQSPRPDLRAGIAIRAVPGEARFSLRLDDAAAKAVGVAAGFRLDAPLNSHSGSGERSAARLGPNEWLLIAPDSEAEIVPGQLDAALAGHFHVLVDVGHRNVGIQVVGRHAPDVLNSGCPLDLSAAAFPTGSATRTLLGKAEVVLMRLDDTPSYRVECWRSFAPYVHEYLLEAAREFEPVSR
jgi:sarcosine oxidase subunit gamma